MRNAIVLAAVSSIMVLMLSCATVPTERPIDFECRDITLHNAVTQLLAKIEFPVFLNAGYPEWQTETVSCRLTQLPWRAAMDGVLGSHGFAIVEVSDHDWTVVRTDFDRSNWNYVSGVQTGAGHVAETDRKVTVSLDKVALDRILTEIAKQAGITFAFDPSEIGPPKYSIHATAQPWQTVLAKVLRHHPASLYRYGKLYVVCATCPWREPPYSAGYMSGRGRGLLWITTMPTNGSTGSSEAVPPDDQ